MQEFFKESCRLGNLLPSRYCSTLELPIIPDNRPCLLGQMALESQQPLEGTRFPIPDTSVLEVRSGIMSYIGERS